MSLRKTARTSLIVEPLEDRLVPSWTGTPPTTISIPTASTITLTNNATGSGTGSITNNEIDYFTFVAPRTGSYRINALTPSSNLDTVLGVFNADGRRLAYNDDMSASVLDSQLSTNLTAGQRYYFGITNYTNSRGGAYNWSVTGPAAPVDDAYEDNDTQVTANNLGTLTTRRLVNNLVLADSADWFRFTMTGAGNASSYVSLTFTHSRGDLDLRLYDSNGNLVRYSAGHTNGERISLNGLLAGTYYVQVYGYRGATNSSYSLDIVPGTPSATTSNRILYLNFDGYNISRSELVRWAGSDWSGNLQRLDSDGNGITVQRALANRTDREQVISRIMELLREDLRPFGITVQRITTGAVEGQGATTVFIGRSTLSNGNINIASEVDYGNSNRTDIAFVGDEDWGTTERTALAMADVILHEAGHTWGLWHVNSGSAAETMGIRYSISDQNQWAQNTSFLDRTFVAYTDSSGAHGPGPQNSYQAMMQIFSGAGTNTVSSPARNPSFTTDASQTDVFTVTTSSAAVDQVSIRRLANGNLEVVINGRSYELASGYRVVNVYTNGDSRDQVRVVNNLGGVRVNVNRIAGADSRDIAKGPSQQASVWAGNQLSQTAGHNNSCGCALCRGGVVAV